MMTEASHIQNIVVSFDSNRKSFGNSHSGNPATRRPAFRAYIVTLQPAGVMTQWS